MEQVRAHSSQQSLWDKFWRDRRGQVVIWQIPNIWLIGWALLTFISLFFTGKPATVLSLVADILLAIWGILEVWKGVNYFRKLLGLVVLIFVVMSFANYIGG